MACAHAARHSLQCLVLAACWIAPAHVSAVTVSELYTVTVERDPAAQNERADAVERAMIEVITRVTGSRVLARSPELEPLLSTAGRYVDAYGPLNAREVFVRFTPGNIEQALTSLGLPIWGAERPLTILWIAVTDQFGDSAILSSGEIDLGIDYGENMEGILETLRTDIADVARARGMPYVLPLLDVQDLASVDFVDIWNFDLATLTEASMRYAADSIVIARVRASEIGSDVEWLMSMGFDQRSLPGASIQQGIDWLADVYATQFASVGGARPMVLRVTGVADFESYARVMSYLEQLSLLDRVDIESFDGGDLMLRVQSRADAEVLARVLSLGGVLRESRSFGGSGVFPGSMLSLEVVRNDPFR